ncbi:MAG: branched-chain amino acid ABC transporter permease [Desulfatiglandales bacterium]
MEAKRPQLRKERIDRGIKVRADDIFALNSWREVIYLVGPRAIPVVGLLVLGPFLSAYSREILISTASYALLAISWDYMMTAGLASLGQSLLFGIGAYFTGILNHYFHLPWYITIPIATLTGSAFVSLLLTPVLRLRGVYFSMITLVLPLMFMRLIEATRILGGTEGLTGLDPFPNEWVSYYLIMFALLFALFGFRRLGDSDYGLIIRAIKDDDRSVMNAGLNVYWYKAQALFVGGCVGCFVGAFSTHYDMFCGMPGFALDYSIMPIACTLLGGMGSFAGALIGAFILVPLAEVLRAFGALRIVFYGGFLAFSIVALPEGLFHYLSRKYHQIERWVEVR